MKATRLSRTFPFVVVQHILKKNLFLFITDEVKSIKMKINSFKDVMGQVWLELSRKLHGSQDLSTLVESLGHDEYLHSLVKLYEKEIHIIDGQKDDLLSSKQKTLLQERLII